MSSLENPSPSERRPTYPGPVDMLLFPSNDQIRGDAEVARDLGTASVGSEGRTASSLNSRLYVLRGVIISDSILGSLRLNWCSTKLKQLQSSFRKGSDSRFTWPMVNLTEPCKMSGNTTSQTVPYLGR